MGRASERGIDPSTSNALAREIHSLSFDELSDSIVSAVERCFVDTVGVMFAGIAADAGQVAVNSIDTSPESGTTTILGMDEAASRTDAAFGNGTAAHALDFDDVSDAMMGHSSVCLIPPILAIAESKPVSGPDAITGYVAGFETEASLAERINPEHYQRGWHATSTFGTFGAAAASAKVLGLSEQQIATALNIAASMPAGLKKNFGSMVKPMHAGHAARSGLTAADLAAHGFSAADNAIEGSRGFLDLYGEDNCDIPINPDWSEGFAIEEIGVCMKKFPCCYFANPAIAAVITIMEDHRLARDDVGEVVVIASGGAGDALSYPQPRNETEGKFSMEYVVAHGIVHGHVGLKAFTQARLTDPAVDEMRRRVRFEVDPNLEYTSYRTNVRIQTESERVFQHELKVPPGHHRNPLSDDELREKFLECAVHSINQDRAEKIYDTLTSLSGQVDAARFLQAL